MAIALQEWLVQLLSELFQTVLHEVTICSEFPAQVDLGPRFPIFNLLPEIDFVRGRRLRLCPGNDSDVHLRNCTITASSPRE
jgi:hypothetical protein